MVAQAVRQNPIKSATAGLGFVAAVVGLVFLVEDRYANAADLQQFQTQQQAVIEDVRKKVKDDLKGLRVKQVEDQLFILQFKQGEGTATPLDKALIQKYTNELNDLR